MKSGHFRAEHIPEDLRGSSQWVGFRVDGDKKTPFIADAPSRKASSTDRNTWRSFDTALAGLRKGDFNAIAYALDSDFVGVDLDDCFDGDGDLNPYAAKVITRCASYTETSYSGEGIHIVLRGTLPGGKGRKLCGVELYTQSRFFICTGDRLPDTPEGIQSNQDVINWLLREDVTEQAEQSEQSEQTQAILLSSPSLPVVHSVCTVAYSPDEVIRMTMPRRPGERNRRVHDLARGLRFNAGLAMSSLRYDVKPIVRKWYDAALPVIRTKAFDETWADFTYSWHRVKLPLGMDALMMAWEKSKTVPLPAVASEYDSEPVRQLIGLCAALASLSSGNRFFLSTHDAGRLLNTKPMAVWRWLKMLKVDGLLEELETGHRPRSTRYRWKGSTDQACRNVKLITEGNS